MRYFAYARVSTSEQSESGLGVEAQLHACERFARETLYGSYVDEGVSGVTELEGRPALLRAISELRRGDTLIVAKRDRLGRDLIAVAMIERAIERKGARVLSAAGEGTGDNDPSSVLMRRMVDAFAEYERLVIGARTSAALQAKKRQGKRVGSVPFGYRLAPDGEYIIEEPSEQEIIREALRLRNRGLSLRAIAERLDRKGFRSRAGSLFAPVQVSRMLAVAA